MIFFGTSKIEGRILEIKKTLSDVNREKEIAKGVAMPIFEGLLRNANRPLLDELEELKLKRQFAHDNRQLLINIGSIIVALFIAFIVPYWQEYREQKEDIDAVYRTIIANQDIFIGNSNEFKIAQRTGMMSGLPQPYIQYNLNENTLKKIQKSLGIVQYQFFLYYLNQTGLLNDELDQLKSNFITTGSKSLKKLDPDNIYSSAMDYLGTEAVDAKFNYLDDTTCLIYMFQTAFDSIKVLERESHLSCSNNSLNRIFNFGYIPVDTPKWLIPQLRDVLNKREAGLGDRLISE